MGKLNAASVRGLVEPGRYSDGLGLSLDVRGGSRVWVYRYQLNNRPRLMSLGSADSLSLADARAAHSAARARVLSGVDPLDARVEAKREAAAVAAASVTFNEAADAYIEAHRAEWRPRGEAWWRGSLALYAFPVFGSLPVGEVTTDDVLRALSPIWTGKTVTASTVRSRIEMVLSYAKARGWRSGENPARWRDNLDHLLAKPAKLHRVTHRAALDWREAPALMAALAADPSMGALCLRFLVLTAARSGEARGATWGEIDLSAGLWSLPAARMKAGRDHRVPLSEPAQRLLAGLAEMRCGDFVFWGRAAMVNDTTLSKVLRRLGYNGITVHGFRSTFSTWAADHRMDTTLVETSLAHTVGNAVSQAYQRSDLLEARRVLMEAWASYLTKPPAQVIKLVA
jgi:integrase